MIDIGIDQASCQEDVMMKALFVGTRRQEDAMKIIG